MKKIIIILTVLLVTFIVACSAKTVRPYTAENYPLKGSHQEGSLTCTDCHVDGDYAKRVQQETCLTCHESYDELAKKTSHLGYDDNIHASPHYPKMDCDLCHNVHTASKGNYCVMCHSQPPMVKLVTP